MRRSRKLFYTSPNFTLNTKSSTTKRLLDSRTSLPPSGEQTLWRTSSPKRSSTSITSPKFVSFSLFFFFEDQTNKHYSGRTSEQRCAIWARAQAYRSNHLSKPLFSIPASHKQASSPAVFPEVRLRPLSATLSSINLLTLCCATFFFPSWRV